MTNSYLRYPHVHGDQVVFVADDDLWLAPLAGGRAVRLTTDRLPVRTPRFSPDGRRVAWAARIGGASDVMVLDLDTGEQRRVTWLSARGIQVAGWLDSDTVVVASAHQQHDAAVQVLYTLDASPAATGVLEAMHLGTAMEWAPGPDERLALVTPNNRDSAAWKRYRGGTASQLWLRTDGAWHQVLADEAAGKYSAGWFAGRLFFSSDLEASLPGNPGGQAQLCSVDADGNDLEVHTHHTVREGYVRNPTTDGATIVYHAHGRLYALEALDAEPREIDVQLGLGAPRPEQLTPQANLDRVVPDHGGDGSLLEWRGGIWFLTHRAGPARAVGVDQGIRRREPDVLGRSGQGVWVSDAEGDDCLEVGPLTGNGEVRRLVSGQVGRVLHLRSNPEGTAVALASHDGVVRVLDLATGAVVQAGRSGNGEPDSLTWSPDGRWLVWRDCPPWAVEGNPGNLVAFDTHNPDAGAVALTSGRFNDLEARFTRDGKYLVFLSQRTFDPHYDELGFDLAFGDSVRPWLVPLRADQPAPFGPSADGWAIAEMQDADDAKDNAPGEDDAQQAVGKDAEAAGSGEQKPPVAPVEIDVAGFEQRMVAFPVPSGDYSDLEVVDGGVTWLHHLEPHGVLGAARAGVEGEEPAAQVERFGFESRRLEVLVPRADEYAVSGDGKRLVVRTRDDLAVVPSDNPVEDDDTTSRVAVDLSRLRRQVSPRDEWRQMFDENGRLMRDHYWRADLDGIDWQQVLDTYRPLVDRLHGVDDLVDVLYEVVGELNTSHSYVVAPALVDAGQRVGLLGADVTMDADGVRITRILPGESSDPRAMSPLRAAGVAAREGDVIVAVDGQQVSTPAGLGELLLGAAGKVVELTLRRDGQTRRVAVVPLAEEQTLRYHDWVARNVAYVNERSQGRVGYVHVPDMMGLGWAQLHRLLADASRREAVLVDVRYNHGGHTSALVIERLQRRVLGWGVARHYDTDATYPDQAMRGPVAFVANRYAGSDGDIVNAAAQELGLGPVIGERTWGGVVGIDGRFDLVDGTEVTQPRYAFHFNTSGWGVENHGVDPDIVVVPDPVQWESSLRVEAMADVQLDAAVDWLLDRLGEHPASTPPVLPAPRARRA